MQEITFKDYVDLIGLKTLAERLILRPVYLQQMYRYPFKYPIRPRNKKLIQAMAKEEGYTIIWDNPLKPTERKEHFTRTP